AHMIPTHIIQLDTLPLTPNGKLDRTALPTPPQVEAGASRAPRNAREEVVAGIFAAVLERTSVGVDDDFFALGGHSLLAIRAVSRLRSALGVECGVRDLFEARTVAVLAGRLAERSALGRPALTRAAHRPALLPLSYAQRRLWLIDHVQGPGTSYNVPFAVRIRGAVDVRAVEAALADLVARHEPLRTVFTEVDGEPYQNVLSPGEARVPFTVRRVPLDRLVDEAEAEGRHVFDLGREIPLRAALLSAADDDHVLVLLLHHIATDEWSTGPLLTDLDTAYRARAAGSAPDFAELPVQYADFAIWQRELLGDPDDPRSVASRQAHHWRETLSGLPRELSLPTDRPRPAVPSHGGDVVLFDVSPHTGERLARIAREHGATMFMVVHAAVAALLHRLGAGDDIPLGTPVSGREDEQVDQLVGFFLNTLVLRADLSGDPTFAELVERIRDTGLAAFSHADLPLEAVAEAVGEAHGRSHGPLFRTMVTYHSTTAEVAEVFGVPAEELPVEIGGSKFDLEFAFGGSAANGTPMLTCGVRYATDLFERSGAERLVERLVLLLDAVAAEPELALSAVPVMHAGERDRVLFGWNDTARVLDGPETLADLVTAG
ncbi:condensation domain-containing protein, partial [Streptomyces antibioticus]|uniref:condensation domain-containing protein n=1 Tax=Streptomyces antibioticus TaxID=1890 RepID=UPI0036CCDED4